MAEFTNAQTDRQDVVDNACHNLLNELSMGTPVEWNMEHIGKVRDAVQQVLVEDLHLLTEMQFHPYITLERGA